MKIGVMPMTIAGEFDLEKILSDDWRISSDFSHSEEFASPV